MNVELEEELNKIGLSMFAIPYPYIIGFDIDNYWIKFTNPTTKLDEFHFINKRIYEMLSNYIYVDDK